MGSHFFKPNGSPKIIGGNQNMTARAIGSSVYAARGAAANAQKGITTAAGINKDVMSPKPLKRSAAYAPGPKKT